MLAIDLPGLKRIFITNSTTKEMIIDIFFNKQFKQAFKNIFFLSSGKSLQIIPLDIQNDIHDTRTRKNYFYQEKRKYEME